jgi:hypothetical protein
MYILSSPKFSDIAVHILAKLNIIVLEELCNLQFL